MNNHNLGIPSKTPGVTRVVHKECDVHFQVHKNTLKSSLDDFLKEYFDINNFWAWVFNLITLFLTLATSSFKDFLSISASVWNAVFLIATALVTIWVFICFRKAWKSRGKDSTYFVNSLQNDISKSRDHLP